LTVFFKKKFFVYQNIKKLELDSVVTVPVTNVDQESSLEIISYEDLSKLTLSKVALELPLYAGKVLFVKQQTVIISLVYFFQPPKGDFKKKIAERKDIKKNLSLHGSLYYGQRLNFNNPLFFNKNTF
jgi:hypothetical protein